MSAYTEDDVTLARQVGYDLGYDDGYKDGRLDGLSEAVGAVRRVQFSPEPPLANTVRAATLRVGDRFMAETPDETFPASLRAHFGWGMVHGCMDWQCAREDGTEFVYSIHIDAPVTLIEEGDKA